MGLHSLPQSRSVNGSAIEPHVLRYRVGAEEAAQRPFALEAVSLQRGRLGRGAGVHVRDDLSIRQVQRAEQIAQVGREMRMGEEVEQPDAGPAVDAAAGGM